MNRKKGQLFVANLSISAAYPFFVVSSCGVSPLTFLTVGFSNARMVFALCLSAAQRSGFPCCHFRQIRRLFRWEPGPGGKRGFC